MKYTTVTITHNENGGKWVEPASIVEFSMGDMLHLVPLFENINDPIALSLATDFKRSVSKFKPYKLNKY